MHWAFWPLRKKSRACAVGQSVDLDSSVCFLAGWLLFRADEWLICSFARQGTNQQKLRRCTAQRSACTQRKIKSNSGPPLKPGLEDWMIGGNCRIEYMHDRRYKNPSQINLTGKAHIRTQAVCCKRNFPIFSRLNVYLHLCLFVVCMVR